MLDMKCDMSGAAAVIATLWYLDASEISHNFA
jgi:leucyl aminopeptidase